LSRATCKSVPICAGLSAEARSARSALSTQRPFQIMCRGASGMRVLEKRERLGVDARTVLPWGRGQAQAPVEGCLFGVDEMGGQVGPECAPAVLSRTERRDSALPHWGSTSGYAIWGGKVSRKGMFLGELILAERESRGKAQPNPTEGALRVLAVGFRPAAAANPMSCCDLRPQREGGAWALSGPVLMLGDSHHAS
jgi:hypothetical protein